MTPETGSPPGDDFPLDPARARAFLLACVRHRLDRESHETHEDLAQTALVGLVRAARRGTIDNPDAFMNTLADHVVVDFLRARRRWRLLLEPFHEGALEVPDGAGAASEGDPVERLRFVVAEYFVREHAPCADLAREYFAEVPWHDVAERAGLTYAAVRKQWSRCVERLKAAAAGDTNPLLEWCHD